MKLPLLVVLGLAVAFAAGYATARLGAPAPPPEAGEGEAVTYRGIIEDIGRLKMLKPESRQAALCGIDARMDAAVADLDRMGISDDAYRQAMWQLKDYVVQYRVPIAERTYASFAALPARQVGVEARYDRQVPLASEQAGMAGYERKPGGK